MSNLEKVLDKLNKTYGKGTVMNLGERPKNEQKGISTGSIGLDLALGTGGFARNRMIEIYGWEGTSKTTLTINAIAAIQKEGGKAAYLDMEHAFDPSYAEKLGVDTDSLIFTQPDHGEQCLEIAKELIRTGEVDLCIIDSVTALIPEAETQGEIGDSKMGLHARLMAQTCRTLSPLLSKNECTLIFVNQLREKIGVMYGDPSVTTGGNSLKFYASQRIEVKRMSDQSNKDKSGNIVSIKVKATVKKNKVAVPFKWTEFKVGFGEGIDRNQELIDMAEELEIIQKSGSWFSYNDQKIGQGKDQVKQTFKDNPELFEEIEAKVLEQIG